MRIKMLFHVLMALSPIQKNEYCLILVAALLVL